MKTKKLSEQKQQEAEDGHKTPQQEYIVTQTLSGVLRAFRSAGLQTPSAETVRKTEESIVKAIQAQYRTNNVRVVPIEFEDQCDKISTAVRRAKKVCPSATIVSTAPMLSFETSGVCIEMSRIVDLEGKIIGIGARPGHPSIERQLARVHAVLYEQHVIIAEDGSFTGGTLKYLLTKLKERGARVETVVIGILFPQAEKEIRSVYSGEIIPCYKFSNLLDWMPSHDFIPFLPNSGRTVGFKMGTNVFPLYLHDGASVCMPYIRPYGKPEEWASLQDNRDGPLTFSMTCLRFAQNLFEEMERLNGREICIADIYDSTPRTSIPISPDSSSNDGPLDFSELPERITSILCGDQEFLS